MVYFCGQLFLFNMHITITGDLGSGKSTVAKELCRILGYTYLSTGQIQRNLAMEMGMNTLEFNRYTDQNLHIDDYIDKKVKEINDIKEPHVLDSRLAWHFINTSFKIYLMALDEVAAARVMKDDVRIGEPLASDIQGKIKELRDRRESENQRFSSNYGVKPSLFTDFDAVVDTSTATIENVTQLLVSLYQMYVLKLRAPKIWLSPLRILPTRTEITTDFSEMYTGNQPVFYKNPITCFLYKREFYLSSNLNSLHECLENKCPFIPVELISKNMDDQFDISTFINHHFYEDDLLKMEDKYNFKYIRQQL
ncbi:MAG: AAA family ATPase [Saprospiraceae bacterium]|nr:AAA family ATPase [Saprospiraceae bacterium]MBK8819472.1 AAA family ATPase [Saprospiraceae bacterium]